MHTGMALRQLQQCCLGLSLHLAVDHLGELTVASICYQAGWTSGMLAWLQQMLQLLPLPKSCILAADLQSL